MGIHSFVFLAIACFCAAFIDAISGGGGLITVPAYLASGLPPHIALGTNKVAVFFSATSSFTKFAQSGKVNWVLAKRTALFSLAGAALGVVTVVKFIASRYLYPIAIVMLLAVLIYTLYNKNMGTTNAFRGLTDQNVFRWSLMAFALGFYDGFFGPGTGSFLIFALIKIFHYDFTNASGNAKVYNLMSNIGSVIFFAIFGKANYILAVSIGLIMMVGGFLGAKFAVRGGAKFIKPVFLSITTIVLTKMILESVFHMDVAGALAKLFA
ncbi:MAG: TSUP family transporter [Fusobacteriaceae bacterium]|jgi:uncharacterized membrane protein YfcA|nr:TSUP family transporter [Fusobacteriaceae bacterium]